jgi:ABC-2 type transport system ATP-binding protein
MSKNAIEVKDVKKYFLLPHEKATTLKGSFLNLVSGKRNKTTERQRALNGISFEIKKGEFYGIVGRNGSGKSTLLKMLAGIYQPSEGSIITKGRLVPFIELGVGFNGELTGRENIYLNGALLGFSKKEIDERYEDIVSFAELERFMDQKLKNYSSGMQVRLAFSLAIQTDTDILLVDEVLAVGDADFQRKCFDYFKRLKREKKTVVFVSHDMSAVREYCDKAILIDKGKIVISGDSDKVATEYLKMFNGTSTSSTNKNLAARWGSKDFEFVSANTDINEKEITIKLTIKVNKQKRNPILGYLIKDATNNELFGTNTKEQKIKIPDFLKDEEFYFEWKIPNILNEGKFFVTLAISESDGITQLDWWNDAVTLNISREDRSPFAINPAVKVKITK